jgi:ABC-type amino acid transport substrate-binding protein
MRTMGWTAAAGALAALALAACGERAPLPAACAHAQAADVSRALRHAPDGVALRDGTRLSTCVARALGDADLQIVGATLTAAADRLTRVAGSDAAAYRLGFLIGATERGAAHTAGVQAELVARMQQVASLDSGPPARRRELLTGRAAGRRRG